MTLSKEWIEKMSASFLDFERGNAILQSNGVKIKRLDTFWRGELGILAEVKEEEKEYTVSLKLSGNQITSASCNCIQAKRKNGLCCHETAALLALQCQKKTEAVVPVRTSASMRSMLHAYTNRQMTQVMAAKMEKKVSLRPLLTVQKGEARVSFYLGVDKWYRLKDIGAFAHAFEERAFVEYGKNLAFYHTPESFDEKSRELLQCVLREAKEHDLNDGRIHTYRACPVYKEIVLSEMNCDGVMKSLKETVFKTVWNAGEEKTVRLVCKNPRIGVTIAGKGREGAEISLMQSMFIFKGEKRLYIGMEDRIYCCDEEYSEMMKDFLFPLAGTEKDGLPKEEINAKDLPAFCDYILPNLSRYADLEVTDIDLEKYHPEKMKASFYFDSPSKDEITLEVRFQYGDAVVTPFEHTMVSSVYRDQVGELLVGTVVKKYFHQRYAQDNLFVIKENEEEIYELLDAGLSEFRSFGEVYLSDAMKNVKTVTRQPVALGISMSENWLDLTVDAGDLEPEELSRLLAAYRMKKRYFRLKDGSFMGLNQSGFGAVSELAQGLGVKEGLEEGGIKVPRYRALFIDQVLKDSENITVRRNSDYKSLIRGMKSVEDSDFEVPVSLRSVLREYQKVGFRWLRTLDAYGFGGILADDMGLGKTLQVISLILDEKSANNDALSLIVCPASLVYNWENEIQNFAPELRSLVITGNGGERQNRLSQVTGYDVLITSYDLLRRDLLLYEKLSFRFQIIDEAQFIKNHGTQSAKAVRRIHAQTRFALTGTPIENRLSELWSIFDYLMPGFLYSYSQFRTEIETPVIKEGDETVLRRLHRMISPFILRRVKEDVLKELPPKLETVIYSRLEDEQRNLYAANALETKKKLQGQEDREFASGKLQILAELMRLRQICCDPRLCYENYKGGSAKLETCMELLLNGVEAGNKILLFSQFTSMLALLEERLKKENISCYVLTGKTSKEERISMVNHFNHDEIPVFLISLKAGGTGLNLTAADMVIHYDPWWNIAAQNQATDRAHRIGQTKVVSVFKLITKNTIEENILKLQQQKSALTEQVIGLSSVNVGSLTKEELLEILM